MSAHPRALVLDFGGVVTKTLFETHALTEQALGLKPGTLAWRGPFDPADDPLWRSMQADAISERDYWKARTRAIGALVGEDWTEMSTFVRRACGADPQTLLPPGPHGRYALPFVYVFGRADFTLSYYGANIYPENIAVGLEQGSLAR